MSINSTKDCNNCMNRADYQQGAMFCTFIPFPKSNNNGFEKKQGGQPIKIDNQNSFVGLDGSFSQLIDTLDIEYIEIKGLTND